MLHDILFIVAAVTLLLFLIRINFVHYDNFSHWAIVVKDMLITDSIPTSQSVLIDFKNYPIGTASFIYYVCKAVGYSEGIMIFSQGLIVFSCFYAIFGIVSEKRRFLLYTILSLGFSILSIFNISIRIDNLLVDFLLPILSLTSIAITYVFKSNINKGLLINIPIIGLLVITKSTGVIFAIFSSLYILYICHKYKKVNNDRFVFLRYSAFTLLSYATILLWNIHLKLNFFNIENKFEVHTDLLLIENWGESMEEMNSILNLFLSKVFDITELPTLGIILFTSLSIALCIVSKYILKKRWALPKVTMISFVVVIMYMIGILALYLFSMPIDEAMYLAGYERYSASIVIFYGGLLTMCLVCDIENSFEYRIGDIKNYKAFKSIQSKKLYNNTVLFTLLIACLILSSDYNGMKYNSKQYNESLPYKFKNIVGDRWPNEVDSSKYLVYTTDENEQIENNYLQYISRYYLYADSIDATNHIDENNFVQLSKNYDYIIILNSDDNIQYLMMKYYTKSGDVGIYSLS